MHEILKTPETLFMYLFQFVSIALYMEGGIASSYEAIVYLFASSPCLHAKTRVFVFFNLPHMRYSWEFLSGIVVKVTLP